MARWIRMIEVHSGGKIYKDYKTEDDKEIFEIEFDIPFSDEEEPDIAEVSIYNLSRGTIDEIIENGEMFVNAGYKGLDGSPDIGNVLTGQVDSDVQEEWSGPDKKVTFLISDSGKNARENSISKTYKSGTKASLILRDLANRLGVEVMEISPVNDITYPRGRVVNGNVYKELQAVAKDTGSKAYIHKNKLYVRAKETGNETGFILNHNTGLVGSPERMVETETPKDPDDEPIEIIKYKVTALLIHQISVDSLIKVESDNLNGTFRVESGVHTKDFNTEMIVVP